jgi:hypothetical protein
MKLGALLTVNAVIAGVFGLAFIFVPAATLSVYGVTADAQFAMVGQLFGAALLGFGLLTWSARNAADSEARRAIVFALFVSDAAGFVIALMAQLRGLVNVNGWSTVVIYLVLALGFAFFQFRKSATAPQ